jgi:hypothetical protein
MKIAKKPVQVKIYLPSDVKVSLDRKHAETGLSRSMIVELLVRNHLNDDIVRGLKPTLEVEDLVRDRAKPKRQRTKVQTPRQIARADHGKKFQVDFKD